MRIEGRAINIKIIAGKIVQIISIVWPWSKKRLIKVLKNKDPIKYLTIIVIIIRINKEWSWKKINCSIRGEALSCKFKFDHVAIVLKKEIFFINEA